MEYGAVQSMIRSVPIPSALVQQLQHCFRMKYSPLKEAHHPANKPRMDVSTLEFLGTATILQLGQVSRDPL